MDDQRRDRLWTLGMGIVVLGFTVVVLGPALLGRGVLLDVELLRTMWPYHATGRLDDAIICRSDTIDSVTPTLANVRHFLGQGSILTWTQYEVGGAPLAALPNAGLLSPVTLPFWVLPLWLAPAYAKLIELVLVIGGMVLLLGRFGVRRSAALLAGLVFFTSGFMIMWSGWPQTKTAAFVPLLFWSLDRVVVNRRPVDVALVGLVLAAMLLGGFPAVTMYALTFGGIYVLARGIQQARAHGVTALVVGWLGALAGIVLGVGLAAIQMVPFVQGIGDIGYETRGAGGPNPRGYAISFIAPDALGACRGGEASGPTNPVEAVAFLGAGALVLVAVAFLVSRAASGPRRPYVLGACFALAFVLAWLGGPLLVALQHLPGYDHNPISRMSSLLGFLTAVLAGFGFDLLLRRTDGDADPDPDGGTPRTPRRTTVLRIIAAVVVLAVATLYLTSAYLDGRPWAAESGRSAVYDRRVAVGAALVVLGIVGAVLTLVLRGRLRVIGPVVVAAVVAGQSLAFAHQTFPTSPRADFYPVTPAHRFLIDHTGHDRYATAAVWGDTSIGDFYRIRTPLGHEFTDPDWKEMLKRVDPDVERTRTYSTFTANLETADVGRQPILDQLAVRYWATAPTDLVAERANRPVAPDGVTARVDHGRQAHCRFGARPLRGVQFKTGARFKPARKVRPILHVRITTASGEVIESAAALTHGVRQGGPLRVGVPGEHVAPTGKATVDVWATGTRGKLELAGPRGQVACAALVPPAGGDGLELVHADAGSLIYERPSALPRIRWTGRSKVVPDPDEQLDLLEKGGLDDTALLSEGTPDTTPDDGTVDVLEDEGPTIRAKVDAEGHGYLLVADSIARKGWTATVDGKDVPLLSANRAFAAVPVDGGTHTVKLHYDPPGLRTGTYLTGVSGIVVLALCGWSLLLRRRTRRRAAEHEEGTLGP